MERIARQDAAALQALYDRHGGLVFTLCQKILKDRGVAEDVLFEVFFELWERGDRYDRARSSAVTYLATVARSRALDRLRSRRSREPRELRATASGDVSASSNSV